MKVATYCRISTDEVRQPFSLEAQRDRLASYVAVQDGWKVVRSYTDQRSGKSLDRPGLQQALAEAAARRYDLLLVLKVDRLARSTAGLVRVLEDLEVAGVAFRSASEPFDTSTAAGRMMVQMLAVFAEFEREMIVERTKIGLAKKASKGEWTGGRPPFGYGYDLELRALLPVEDEAGVVRRIFDRYAHRRWGSAAISRWLNETCQVTRRGSSWTPKTVIDILRNPTYVGRLPFNGEAYEAAHEPIVGLDVFDRAQATLRERGESYPLRASNATEYVLTGLLRCARCGHGFIGTAAHGKVNTYRYYTCYSRQRQGTSRCDQERMPADSLEEAIISETVAALENASFFEEAAEAARDVWLESHSGGEAEIRRVEGEIVRRRKSIDRLLRAFEGGSLPENTCGYRVRDLDTEIAAHEAEKVALEAELAQAPTVPSRQSLEEIRYKIEQALREGDREQVKDLLAAVVDEIVVESRACIQPYFVAPGVRTLLPSRRRAGIEPTYRLSSLSRPERRFGPTLRRA